MVQQLLDKINKRKKGFVTLVSVIILGVVGVIVITATLSVSTDNILGVATVEQTKQARALADSCAEIAIDRLKTNLAYIGNETVVTSFGNCSIGIVSGTGNTNRTFQVSATYKDEIRRINIVISQVNPLTNITQWQEAQ